MFSRMTNKKQFFCFMVPIKFPGKKKGEGLGYNYHFSYTIIFLCLGQNYDFSYTIIFLRIK